MSTTSHHFNGISLAILAILLLPMISLSAQDKVPTQAPNKLSTIKGALGSPLKQDSDQKSPIQFEAELDEIMAIRKKLGGGVAEQLKGLNMQLDPNKESTSVDQASPDFRELLAEQSKANQEQTSEKVDLIIPPGHKVLAVKVPADDALTDLMKTGDVVDVISSNDAGNETIAKAVKVYFLSKGRIGLLVSNEVSDVIVAAREKSQIRLALVSGKEVKVQSRNSPRRVTLAANSPAGSQELVPPQAQAPQRIRQPSSVIAPTAYYPSPPIAYPYPGTTPTLAANGINQTPCSRARKAARMVEEAAAELEESGKYELADQLRKNAQKIWESAR